MRTIIVGTILSLAAIGASCSALVGAAQKQTISTLGSGSIDFGGAVVQFHWVDIINERGSNEYCIATTLQGGIATVPLSLCDAATENR